MYALALALLPNIVTNALIVFFLVVTQERERGGKYCLELLYTAVLYKSLHLPKGNAKPKICILIKNFIALSSLLLLLNCTVWPIMNVCAYAMLSLYVNAEET